MTSTIPSVVLPSGEAIAVLGQGTWHFGEHRARRSDEIASLRLGLDPGDDGPGVSSITPVR
jgi:hypothetical protein